MVQNKETFNKENRTTVVQFGELMSQVQVKQVMKIKTFLYSGRIRAQKHLHGRTEKLSNSHRKQVKPLHFGNCGYILK